MEIISHRGFWNNTRGKNSVHAFDSALSSGFGIETDVRDYDGNLVISHNIPNENSQTVDSFLNSFSKSENNYNLCLAINIKSDGLQSKVKFFLEKYRIKNYFVFDMSIPDMLGYVDSGINCFIRQSEIEHDLLLIDGIKGVWLDQFKSTWFDKEILLNYLNMNIKVCVVSSELHGRDHSLCWSILKEVVLSDEKNKGNLMLCTDIPDKAKEYFYE